MSEEARPSVVIVRCYRVESLRARSQREPDPLFVNIGGLHHLARGGVTVQMHNFVVARLVLALYCADRTLSAAELIELLWGDDPAGGPENADVELRAAIVAARVAGAALGLVVTTRYARGYSLRLQVRSEGAAA